MTFDLGIQCHTFTIIGRCADTGAMGVAITTSPPAVSARCPLVRTGVGAVSSQAFANPALSHMALRLLALGYSPEGAIEEMRGSDEWFEYRQIGIVDRSGRSAVFTGSENADWKGSVTDTNFAAMGNLLTGEAVVTAMAGSFRASGGALMEDRLLTALQAGRDAGGEKIGHNSGGVLVHGDDEYARTDLRIDWADPEEGRGDAIDGLWRLLNLYRPLIEFYEKRPNDPHIGGWQDWLENKKA